MESHGTTIGKVMTNGMDSIITDSANSASSYQNGHKGFVNALNVNGDTSADTLDDPKIETMAEILRRNRPNTCIGVVSTAEIQDATPASVFAHTRRRGDKAIITVQNLEQTFEQWTPPPAQVDVLFGGGGAYFCNGTSACRSLDGRDMYAEYSAKGYKLVTTTPELEQHVPKGEKVLGIFAANNLDTWIDRVLLNSNLGATNSSPLGEASTNYQQAGLELMVAKAVSLISGPAFSLLHCLIVHFVGWLIIRSRSWTLAARMVGTSMSKLPRSTRLCTLSTTSAVSRTSSRWIARSRSPRTTPPRTATTLLS
jgi:alkaline phosphatase